MEDVVKWEQFVNENDIDVNELPENVQHKIEMFEETYSEYDATDDDEETALRDLEVKLSALDNGILSDLQSFVAKRKTEASSRAPKAEKGGQTPPAPVDTPPAPPQHQASDKPSWAFWL